MARKKNGCTVNSVNIHQIVHTLKCTNAIGQRFEVILYLIKNIRTNDDWRWPPGVNAMHSIVLLIFARFCESADDIIGSHRIGFSSFSAFEQIIILVIIFCDLRHCEMFRKIAWYKKEQNHQRHQFLTGGEGDRRSVGAFWDLYLFHSPRINWNEQWKRNEVIKLNK